MNEKLIEELVAHKERVTKNEKELNLRNFKLGDLKVEVNEKDRKISLSGVRVEGKALTVLADKLKVKPAFFDLSKKIGESEFEQINSRLKSFEEETPIYASVLHDDHRNEDSISEMFFTRPEMKGIIKSSTYFDMVIESLKDTPNEYQLNGFHHTEGNSFIELLNFGKDLLVLPGDNWKTGSMIKFNATEFNINPFFLRTICSNGMQTNEQGFTAKISNKKYNESKIQVMITEKLNAQFDLLEEEIQEKVEKFSKNNISVSEFRRIRNQMISALRAGGERTIEDAVSLTNKFLPDAHLYEAYKINYTQKPDQWLKTADSGINAYDAFNKVTWVASHPKQTGVSPMEASRLMIEASNLLFKSEGLDMSNLAPKVRVNLKLNN